MARDPDINDVYSMLPEEVYIAVRKKNKTVGSAGVYPCVI